MTTIVSVNSYHEKKISWKNLKSTRQHSPYVVDGNQFILSNAYGYFKEKIKINPIKLLKT